MRWVLKKTFKNALLLVVLLVLVLLVLVLLVLVLLVVLVVFGGREESHSHVGPGRNSDKLSLSGVLHSGKMFLHFTGAVLYLRPLRTRQNLFSDGPGQVI